MRYELLWRNKYLTSEAHFLDEMVDALERAADELRAMQAKGVTLEDDGCQADDYARLVTDNADVAAEFGFEPPDEDELPDDYEDAEEAGTGPVVILETGRYEMP